MSEQSWYDDLPIPALMRGARGSYGDASRKALADAGYEDLPRNAGWIIANMDASAGPKAYSQSEVTGWLRTSKQASSQMIDTLVVRGYLEREIDPEDRRRMNVRLTERGAGAAAAIQTAVDAIDAALAERISAEELNGLRAGLAALTELRKAGRAAARIGDESEPA